MIFAILIGIGVVVATKPTVITAKVPLTIETIQEIEIDKEPIIEPVLEEETIEPEKTITVIGDSILYDVAPFLKNHYPEAIIDFRVGRQMAEVPDVIQDLESNGQLGEYVVIQLGTNGPFSKTDVIKVIEHLGDKKVFLLNCRVPRAMGNDCESTLEEVVASMPNTVLVDWYSASAGHAEFFAGDGVHLTKIGGETYANLLVEQLEK